MMKRQLFLFMMMMVLCLGAAAQRTTDNLDRGLVAVYKNNGSSEGCFVSWRVQDNEYYDTKYNLYRNGTKLNSTPLSVSNYEDSKGTSTSQYTVAAVVNGVEQAQCAAVTPWSGYLYKLTHRYWSGYKDITLENVYSNADGTTDITANYSPNDACVADLDGDGEVEIILKRLNTADADSLYPAANTDFAIIEAYKLDGTRLWWIDCGPNMVSLNSTEIDAVAYDWDQDGKAEVVLRGADAMKIHQADDTTYTVGDASVNTRSTWTSATFAWTHTGSEYLLYLNGTTGVPYQVTDYPLKRLESGETDLNAAWGDNYGHRSSKYFFGAPCLDGRKPSIFLARGIYTREKMIALDVDASSHTLTTRWTWNCNDSGSSWYGNGYHNFSVADVDWDGRDEIVYGSMVIDDNGKGLSTTGLGHGDAHHVGDFNPYVHGQEVMACLEDKKGWDYRDATTSTLYNYSTGGGSDDGRCLMGNFSNDHHGAQGRSVSSGIISSVTNADLGLTAESFIPWDELNFRIYWDGDLCDEILNSPGTAKEASVSKVEGDASYVRLFTSSGCNMNNDSKNNPCFQGDILGDWREEIIVRCGTNIRIYTTAIPTTYREPSLWYDHQYRQAMVWQMCAYNQPPHPSFFLGESEGITIAPPPYTNKGRTEVGNGGTISSAHNSKHVMLAETNDMSVSVSDGATPAILFDNAPTWVQGSDDNDNITTTTYTHTLTGGAFAGSMRLVKQGDGTLVLPDVTETYSGSTDVWAGELDFDGTLANSPVWLNRFAKLASNGGSFKQGITMDYGAQLLPGSDGITARSVTMKFGSRIVYDLNSDITADKVSADTLRINTVDWTDGPTYLTPVFEFDYSGTLNSGKYLIGNYKTIEGDLDNIKVEGLDDYTWALKQSGNNLYLVIGSETTFTKKWDFTQGWDVDADVLGASGSGWSLQTASGYMPGYTFGTKLTSATQLTYTSNGTTSTLAKTEGLYFTTNNANNRINIPTTFNELLLNAGTTFTIKGLKKGQRIIINAKRNRGSRMVTLTGTNTTVTGAVTIAPSTAADYTFTVAADGDVTFTSSEIFLEIYSIEVTDVVNEVILDELAKSYNIASQTANATLQNRTIWSDGWNTLCLPFSMTADEVTSYFGSNLRLEAFTSVSGTVMNFTDATTIEAGVPYLIWPATDVASPVFKMVDIVDVDPQSVVIDGYSFNATYTKYTLATDGTQLFLGSGNDLYVPAAGKETMRGYRAWFGVPAGTTQAKIAFPGEATGITLRTTGTPADGAAYNLSGQRVGKAYKGIVIRNGKKYLRK